MLLATIGDILTIRKDYQATYKLNSDESTTDNSLSCLNINKLIDSLAELDPEEPLNGPLLAGILQEAMIEVPIEKGDNFSREISDPDGGGSSIVGYSGNNKYDSYQHYEPESLDDTREYEDPLIKLNKSKKKNTNTEYNQTRITSTGRKARVN